MQQTIQLPTLMRPEEAAKYLGVSTQKLERDRWCEKRIPYVKMGRNVRYRAEDLINYVKSSVVEARA